MFWPCPFWISVVRSLNLGVTFNFRQQLFLEGKCAKFGKNRDTTYFLNLCFWWADKFKWLTVVSTHKYYKNIYLIHLKTHTKQISLVITAARIFFKTATDKEKWPEQISISGSSSSEDKCPAVCECCGWPATCQILYSTIFQSYKIWKPLIQQLNICWIKLKVMKDKLLHGQSGNPVFWKLCFCTTAAANTFCWQCNDQITFYTWVGEKLNFEETQQSQWGTLGINR